MTELATPAPGDNTIRPKSCAPLAETLNQLAVYCDDVLGWVESEVAEHWSECLGTDVVEWQTLQT